MQVCFARSESSQNTFLRSTSCLGAGSLRIFSLACYYKDRDRVSEEWLLIGEQISGSEMLSADLKEMQGEPPNPANMLSDQKIDSIYCIFLIAGGYLLFSYPDSFFFL